MAYTTAEHFSTTHGGFEAIEMFQTLLNTKIDVCRHGKKYKRHFTIIELAEKIQLSPAQTCRLRNGLFDIQYIAKTGTKEFVQNQINYLNREIKQRESFVENQKRLQFIPGRTNEQNRA